MTDARGALLSALSDGPVSGPELADRLGISRAAVWKHVETLREAGFTIESGPGGYTVESVPEYGADAVAFGLEAPYSVEYHDSIDSTNERARELAIDGAENAVVLAGEQTGGRGRLGRKWSSPPGSVAMSVVCRPNVSPAEVPLLTLAAAVAVVRAAREAGVDAGIKWPNDVLVSGGSNGRSEIEGTERKLAGILTEMEGEADRVSWVIVGIGVNANVDSGRLPEGSTSLRAERGGREDVERRVFVQRVLEEFHALRGEPDAILDAWREHALTLGRRVRVETPGGAVVGNAIDVEHPGTLLIETSGEESEKRGNERRGNERRGNEESGDETTIVRVHAGDCEHLRSAE